MSAKAAQKQKSHDAILASAVSLLRKQGIKASSVSDVMAGAGLTVGGFYAHFDSKEHLFAESIRGAARETWSKLLESPPGATSEEQLQSLVGRYLSRTHRDNPEAGCVLPSTANEIAREGGPYRGALERELSGLVASLSKLLGDDTRDEALGLIALMYGALSLARSVKGTPLSDELLKAAKKLSGAVVTKKAKKPRVSPR